MNPWRFAFASVLVTRVALLLVAVGGAWYLGDGSTAGIEDLWRRWDADIYADLAERGYDGDGVVDHSTAFWPLMPLLMRAVTALGIGATAAGMLIAAVSSVVAVAYLVMLAEDDATGRRAGLYLLLAPAAVFLVAGYTEALFLAGTLAAFHHARRGEWAPAAVGGAIAVGTRHIGVFVLAGLAVELWCRYRSGDATRGEVPRAVAALAAATIPLLAYVAWLGIAYDEPLRFLADQRAGWGRGPAWPWEAVAATWSGFRDASANHEAAAYVEIAATAVGVAVVGWTVARREWGFAVFTGLVVAVAVANTWLLSVPRIVLTLFPLYLFAAGWTRDRPERHALVLAVSATLATFGVIVFTRGGWVA